MYLPVLLESEKHQELLNTLLSSTGKRLHKKILNISALWRQNRSNYDLADRLSHEAGLVLEKFKERVLADAIKTKKEIPLVLAESILNHSSSYIRANQLISLYKCSSLNNWFRYFFKFWTLIEMGDEIQKDLEKIFQQFNMKDVMNQYADEESLEYWNNLPDTITVYRGCSSTNVDGFSWTDDLSVAKQFATRRFKMISGDMLMAVRLYTSISNPKKSNEILKRLSTEDAYILKGTVNKDNSLIFINRGEHEFFSNRVVITDEYRITRLEDIEAYSDTDHYQQAS
jgi:hypothetical protein